MSEVYQSLSHSKWDCKYHVIFVPKRRRKVLYGELRQQLKADLSRVGPAERSARSSKVT